MSGTKMKVVLLEDVPSVGQRNMVKEVPAGYARNFLIPKKLAEMATDGKVAELEARSEASEAERKEREAALASRIESLSGQKVEMTEKVNEKGHLFKGLSASDIAAKLSEAAGGDVPEQSVLLEQPIKEVGEHDVSLQGGEKEGSVTIVVSGE